MSKDNSCCATGECCGEPAVTTIPTVPTVPTVSTKLTLDDHLGALKSRLGIGRMDYLVEPGLYAVGKPENSSPVFVSANYKLTFDTLRKNLDGLNCWLLILDTKGINVWCAAGEGTFGTEELIRRIEASELSKYVSHKNLILPQLGATGVSAHEVAAGSGFDVSYGPVRASDIKDYVDAGYKATKEMRTVKFTLWDRLVLTPMELVEVIKISMVIFGFMFLINLFAVRAFGMKDFLAYAAAMLIGSVITPVLLPVVPGKAFAFKGWLLGAIGTAFIVWNYGWFASPFLLLGIGYMLALSAFTSFLAMNFTGASTFTSPSGVLREMTIAVPFIVIFLLAGIVLILIKTFTG
ncbi:MAG: mercury methylation corrinoid protein HgcA [Oscillospiraceae bacterium]|nr:mercury methylation corrinoid protein HgcA [Oscillospiraceae bacterium]